MYRVYWFIGCIGFIVCIGCWGEGFGFIGFKVWVYTVWV